MMISPEMYAEDYLVGKSTEDILAEIHDLQSEIEKLKEAVENPSYYNVPHDCPDEFVRMSCSRDYLEEAKKSLAAAGGEYTQTKMEQEAAAFDAALPNLSRVYFMVGGFFAGNVKYIVTVADGKATMSVNHYCGESEAIPIDKESFIERIKDLHIGEWRSVYSPQKYGYVVLDGTQWELSFSFTDGHKERKMYGSNFFPYNFDDLQTLFVDLEMQN